MNIAQTADKTDISARRAVFDKSCADPNSALAKQAGASLDVANTAKLEVTQATSPLALLRRAMVDRHQLGPPPF